MRLLHLLHTIEFEVAAYLRNSGFYLHEAITSLIFKYTKMLQNVSIKCALKCVLQ